ncbi:hypothetical protein [Thaumasiovibrio sp. DFM-14]|uniref:hypothetical protein n=1 Tax=Thaumasiovibrio sp. DFM-14 TaxID=3384792 RepID=UPI00399F7AA8
MQVKTVLNGVLMGAALMMLAACGSSSDDDATADNTPDKVPEFSVSVVENQVVETGETFTYQLEVVSDLPVSYKVTDAPNNLSVNAEGVIHYTSNTLETTQSDVVIEITQKKTAQTERVSFSLQEQVYLTFNGLVQDFYNGEPIEEGEIELLIDSTLVDRALTTEQGSFSVRVLDIEATNLMVIRANRRGYAEDSVRVALSDLPNNQNLLLAPIHGLVNFDNSQASQLVLDNLVMVELPAASLVNAQGEIVTGNLEAELMVIDPEMDINLMPGEMVTENADGSLSPIESFGAIDVEFFDAAGNALQLAPGAVATIRIPAVGTNPPETIPLYYFDSRSGIWVEEGSATLSYDNGMAFYLGEVSHFTTWNADRLYEIVYIHGCLADGDGVRIANARIGSEGADYNGRSSVYSDAEGNFQLPVKPNSTVRVSGIHGYLSQTTELQVGSTDFQLNECFTLSEALTTITLKWGQHPRDLDSHLYGPAAADMPEFHVYFGNRSVNVEGVTYFLDVDDTTSYGPEVVTIPAYALPGTYRYLVNRFSGEGEISSAETRIEFRMNNQLHVLRPNTVQDKTDWWHVLNINVDESGEATVTFVDEFVSSPDINPVPQAMSLSINNLAERQLNQKYYSH